LTPSPAASTGNDFLAASLRAIPRLAKTSAVRNLAERLVTRGFSEDTAAAIARAVVDPADARSRLDHLTPVRVPGGTVRVLDCMLWTPAIVPYLVNAREASGRRFPIGGGDPDAPPPIWQPEAAEDETALIFGVSSRRHLVASLEDSIAWLQDNNSWNDTIADQGIMVPVIAAVAKIDHADAAEPTTMITTPDGSSRTASALTVLGLRALQVAYEFTEDERRLRQFIAGLQSNLDLPADQISQRDIGRLRALAAPARLLLDFVPDPGAEIDFAAAVDSLVHLVHVEHPKAWDEAAEYDAKAESVLEQMVEIARIPRERRDYFAGMMSPKATEAAGYSPLEDVRAAVLLSVFRGAQYQDAIGRGIRLLDPKKYAVVSEKVKIAVELALRARRAELGVSDARIARNALRAAYQEQSIVHEAWQATDANPDALLNGALKELIAEGPGPQARLLTVLGLYWLGIHRILRDTHFFTEKAKRDGRSPQLVVSQMMRRRWGLHVFHRAIVDGRLDVFPRQVDDDGSILYNADGDAIAMSNQWLRGQVVPEDAPIDIDSTAETPLAQLNAHKSAFEGRVAALDTAHRDLRDITGPDGKSLIDVEGWRPEDVDRLGRQLIEVQNRLAVYAHVWRERHGDPDEDDYER
jgi:hypothetical protein